MFTTADLRSALVAAEPVAALEALARRELNTGRTREALSDAIADLLPELRTQTGYADEWEDRVTDLVDRLTGWTHPAGQLYPTAPAAGVNGVHTGDVTEPTRRSG